MAYTSRKNNIFECGGQYFALKYGWHHPAFECGGQRLAFKYGEQHFASGCGEQHPAYECGDQRAVPTSAWRIFGKVGQ